MKDVACADVRYAWKEPQGCARTARPGLVDRGQEAAGRAIESEPAILPGGALTQAREPAVSGNSVDLNSDRF